MFVRFLGQIYQQLFYETLYDGLFAKSFEYIYIFVLLGQIKNILWCTCQVSGSYLLAYGRFFWAYTPAWTKEKHVYDGKYVRFLGHIHQLNIFLGKRLKTIYLSGLFGKGFCRFAFPQCGFFGPAFIVVALGELLDPRLNFLVVG